MLDNLERTNGMGLSRRENEQEGRVTSDPIRLEVPQEILVVEWESTLPNSDLRVRVKVSPDRRQWSDWVDVTPNAGGTPARPFLSISKPITGHGLVRFVRYEVRIQPLRIGQANGVLSEIFFVTIGANQQMPA